MNMKHRCTHTEPHTYTQCTHCLCVVDTDRISEQTGGAEAKWKIQQIHLLSHLQALYLRERETGIKHTDTLPERERETGIKHRHLNNLQILCLRQRHRYNIYCHRGTGIIPTYAIQMRQTCIIPTDTMSERERPKDAETERQENTYRDRHNI